MLTYHSTKSAPCDTHSPSSTQRLDAELQKPSAQNLLLALSKAFADAANPEECTKCAAESASKALTTFVRETKESKKNGEWSKEDKKAVKKELKDLFKPLKGDMKNAWKGRWEQKQEA